MNGRDPPGPDAAGLLHELRSREVELHHPGSACTAERLDALLHPDFHEVGRSGRTYDRPTVIAHLSSRATVPAIDSWNFQAWRLDLRCALLSYESARRGADGRLAEHALRSSLWLLTDRGWQLRHHQGTPAPAGGPPTGEPRPSA